MRTEINPKFQPSGSLVLPPPWQLLFVAAALAFGAVTTFCQPQQAPSPVITQVEVVRAGPNTVVRVIGNSALTCRTMRLSDPERLVLDFSGARLAEPHPSIPAPFPPILEVRSGQFRTDVARVVIDLERMVPYRMRSEGNSVMVEFDFAASAPVRSAPVLAPAAGETSHLAFARPAETSASPSAPVAGANSVLPPNPPTAELLTAFDPSRVVKIRGMLRDHDGKRLTGVVGIIFAIYEQQAGDAPLWQEVQNLQLDDRGHFTALVGSTTSGGIPPDLFATEKTRWLGELVLLPNELEQPRMRVVSTPEGLMAEGDPRLLNPANSGNQVGTAEASQTPNSQQDENQPRHKPSKLRPKLLRRPMP